MSKKLIIIILLFVLPGRLFADAIDSTAFIAIETRGYPNSAEFDGQDSDSIDPALKFDFDLSIGDERVNSNWHPFLRVDFVDSDRSHFDMRELNLAVHGETWDFKLGVDTVFWGVTESRHLVNIINQNDQLEDIDEEDKLGQPMVYLSLQEGSAYFEFFYLPYFREREFAGDSSRLRGPLPITGRAEYEASGEETNQDFALRAGYSPGSFDLALSYFRGTNREPRLNLEIQESGLPIFVPYYDLIDQLGFEGQFTYDALLLKNEMIYREGENEGFFAAVVGLEYTLYQIFSSSIDLSLLTEYLYDGRNNEKSSATISDNDIFGAMRLAFNDVQDTALLTGVTWDIETSEFLYILELSRRIADNYRLELDSRWFFNADEESPLLAIESDDFITLSLSRYF